MLVHNEDLHVEAVVANVIDFCDQLIVLDNYSTDSTYDILKRLADKFSHLDLHRIQDIGQSHDYIREFADTDCWVFGVDGDELYDPLGLVEMKKQLQAGAFDDWWVVFGNVLNCSRINIEESWAEGYLAPPCRSMTKLYNFSMISSWEGPCRQRLHGGKITFHSGFDLSKRCNLHKKTSWDHAVFRCLHLCFLPRSSKEYSKMYSGHGRLNISERQNVSPRQKLYSTFLSLVGRSRTSPWKKNKYRRGTLVRKKIYPFIGKK